MAQVANNADDYAASRLSMFFPGIIPSLDGQCVSLVKWFLAEMTSVPNPQAARGDARYVGKTLVSQGHAVEVPYDQRRRGDIVTYEYGVYGHIGVILSGNRTFEENVNWPGVASKIVDGARVYASRIGSMAEAWRHDMHIYRIKSYNEIGEPTMATAEQLAALADTRLEKINDIRIAIGLLPRYDTNSVDDILARVRLVTGDIDNIWRDLFGEEPTAADHEILQSGPKDTLYYLESTAKKRLAPQSQKYEQIGTINGQPVFKQL